MISFDKIYNMVKDQTLLPIQNLQTLYNACEQVEALDGIVIEVGVYKGGSLKLISKCLPNHNVYGFDTFEGIPTIVPEDIGIEHSINEFAQDIVFVKEFLSNESNVTLIKGEFIKTHIAIGRKQKICLAHIDTDTYKPTILALNRFYPNLVNGGIILVHDYNWGSTPGVTRAVNEFVEQIKTDNSIKHEIIYPNAISYFEIKRRD